MTQLQKFISTLNLNIKANNFFFSVQKTKFILQLVKLLTNQKYFIGFKVCAQDKAKIIVFFKLNFERNRPFVSLCKQISNSSRPVFMKCGQWPQSSSALVVLSTSKGLLSHKEALRYRLGGIALFKII